MASPSSPSIVRRRVPGADERDAASSETAAEAPEASEAVVGTVPATGEANAVPVEDGAAVDAPALQPADMAPLAADAGLNGTAGLAPLATFLSFPSIDATPTGARMVLLADADDSFAPRTLAAPTTVADLTAPAVPTFSLLQDTGIAGDGITSIGRMQVGGLESGARWQFSTDGGGTWSSYYSTGTTEFSLGAATYAASAIQIRQVDSAGNASAATNTSAITVDSTAPSIRSMATSSGALVLRFDSTLDAQHLPQAGDFSITVNGTARAVTTVAVSGTQATLGLATPLAGGDAVRLRYRDATAGDDQNALQDVAGNDADSVASGAVADGYVRGAQIYIDTDGDGAADAGELLAGVVTDDQGNFFLPDDAPEGALIAVGGTNIDTGLANEMPLRAPSGSTIVTPLTTLVQDYLKSTPGATLAQANGAVTSALGLSADVQLTTFDPIGLLNSDPGDASALAVQRAAVQVATIVSAAAQEPASGTTAMQAANAVLSNLLAEVRSAAGSSSVVDFSNASTLTAIVGTATEAAVSTLVATTQAIAQATTLSGLASAQSDALNEVAPAAPTAAPDLLPASDLGASSSDNFTATTTLTFRVSFNGTAADATAAAVGNTVKVYAGTTLAGTATLTDANVANGYADVTATVAGEGVFSFSATITDATNLTSTASAATAVTIESQRPTVAVAISDTALKAVETATVTFTFSEQPTGFSNADVTYDTSVVSLGTIAATSNPLVFTATLTPLTSVTDASNLLTVGTGWSDAAGNAPQSAAASANFAVDTARPTVAVTLDRTVLNAGDTATVTFTFSDTPVGFSGADLSYDAAGTTFGTLTSTANPLVFTATLTAVAGSTDAVNTVTVGTDWTDAAGNAPSAATSSANYAVDAVAPTVAVSVSDTLLADGDAATVTFTFSEAPVGFTAGDVTYGAGSATLGALTATSDPLVFTATLTPAAAVSSASGAIVVGTGWTDAAGNTAAGTATSANYSVDTVRPTVAISVSDSALQAGETAVVTFTFSEAPVGFTSADVSYANGTLGTMTATADPLVFTAAFTPSTDTTDATNTFAVGTGWTDATGNAPSAISASGNVAIDTAAPSVTVTLADNALILGESTTVTFTFSEAPTGFAAADITYDAGSATLGSITATADPLVFTASLSAVAAVADATNTITVGTGWTDAAGNSPAASSASANYSIDSVAPTVAITLDDSTLASGQVATVTFTFSEVPTGFSAADVTYDASAVTLGSITATADPLVFTATVTPLSSVTDSSNLIGVGTGWTDGAGNAPSASAASANFTVDTTPPGAPAAPQVAEGGGGGINAAEAADGTSVLVSLAGTNAVSGDTISVSWGSQTVSRALTGAEVTAGSATVTVGAGVLSAAGDGSISVLAAITDSSGNAGAAGAATTVVVDTAAPTVSVQTSSAGLAFTVDEAVVVSLGATAVASLAPGTTSLAAQAAVTTGALGVVDAAGNAAATGPVYSLGTTAADTLTTAGTATLFGFDGNDTLTGSASADTLYGGDGNDTLTGGGGIDVLEGGAGNDIYVVAAAADHAAAEFADAGGDAGDTIRFSSTAAGTLTLYAGDTGIDSVAVATAAGVATGTTAERIDASLAPNALTISGNAGNNTLTGTVFDDTLNGNAGNDTLNGGDGNDILTGGTGNDTINGGAGDDLYLVAAAADHAVAEFTDTAGAADVVRFTSAAAGTLTLFAGDVGIETAAIASASGVATGTTAENINAALAPNGLTLLGNAGANTLTGTAYADIINGNAGIDVINGGGAVDALDGGTGNDIYVVAAPGDHGAAEFADSGGDAADVLRFTSTSGQTLILYAGDTGIEQAVVADAAGVATGTSAEGIDAALAPNALSLTGNAGANALTGTAFADVINGAAGLDTLNGGGGSDIYLIASAAEHAGAEVADSGTSGTDTVRFTSAAAGTLTIYSGDTGIETIAIATAAGVATGTTAENINAAAAPNALTLVGNAGANSLTGSAFADTLDGGTGNDVLAGGNGNDVLIGGVGNDTMDGGLGDDTYLIAAAADHGAAEINDAAGAADVLRFTSTAAGTLTLYAGDAGIEVVAISDAAGATTGTTAENVTAANAGSSVTIIGNDGANTLTGGIYNDTILGNGGIDTIRGAGAVDVLDGGAGNDIYLIGSAGEHPAAEFNDTGSDTGDVVRFTSTAAETLVLYAGDAGIDAVAIATSAGVATGTTAENVNAALAPNGLTITGNAGANALTGTAFADTLNGGSGNDVLTGGDGDDVLVGGAGNDTITGGIGNDVYVVAVAADHGVAEFADTSGAADTVRFTSTAAGTLTMYAGDTGIEVVAIADAAGSATGTTAEVINAAAAPNALTLRGNDGANTLTGTAYADSIFGNAGNDVINGGAGDDTLEGGAGNDIYLIASAVEHGAGESISDASGTDTIRFTSAAAGTLTLNATDTGVEVVAIATSAGVATGTTAENIDAAQLASGVTLVGNAGNNVLTGSAYADTINGGAGVDTLAGGDGTDALDGGAGNDIYLVFAPAEHAAAEFADTGGDTGDVLRFTSTTGQTLVLFAGDSGIEQVVIGTAAGVTTGTSAENVDASLASSALALTGNAGANALTGTALADTLYGGGGDDTLDGRSGNDIYLVATAAEHAAAEFNDTGTDSGDTVRFTSVTAGTLAIHAGDSGIEVVAIASAAGVATGTTAENINASLASSGLTIVGNAGNNALVGSAFADVISGGAGTDTLTGGGATDTLDGGTGNDVYIVAAPGDHVAAEFSDTGGDSADVVRFTSTSAQTLTVFAGDSGIEQFTIADAAGVVTGTTAESIDASLASGAVTLTGNAGANTLTGGASADTLNGGGGLDAMDGGAGNDIYIIAAAAEHAAAEIADTGGDTADVVRFTSAAAGTLTLYAGDTGIDAIAIATAAGVATGTTAENINAALAPNALSITGNAGANTLTGTAYADTLNGGAGVDVLVGGAGNDTLLGGTGNDIYLIGAAADHSMAEISDTGGDTADVVRFTSTTAQVLTVFAGDTGIEQVVIASAAGVTTGTTAEGIDASLAPNLLAITGNDGANALTGTAFADTIVGGAGNDTILGGSGVDTITGGTGTDAMDGGTGNDIYLVASATEHAAAEFADTGGDASDTVRFTATSAGTLTIYAADTGIEIVAIATAAGLTTGTTANNVTAAAAPNGLTLVGNAGANALTGSAFADTITGNAGADTISGGGGTDSLDGGTGNDIYLIAAPSEHTAAEFSDTGADTADVLRFTTTTATILSLFASDLGIEQVAIATAAGLLTGTTAAGIDASLAPNALTMTGNAGANALTGTAFADTITGGTGLDTMAGGLGDDIYLIASAAEHGGAEINDSGGMDTIRFTSTAAGTLTLYAGDSGIDVVAIANAAGVTTGTTAEGINAASAPNALTLIGNAGANTLTGTNFADTITGNGGQDIINGGLGSDTITITDAGVAATNSATVVINAVANGLDTITGFKGGATASGGDVINLSGIAALTDSVATGQTLATDFAANNVFIFDSTSITIADAAAALAADASVVATSGYIVIADASNGGAVTVFHSSNLANDGTETALAIFSNTAITSLTSQNILV